MTLNAKNVYVWIKMCALSNYAIKLKEIISGRDIWWSHGTSLKYINEKTENYPKNSVIHTDIECS